MGLLQQGQEAKARGFLPKERVYPLNLRKCCDKDAPQLITHVETTPAPISDEGVLSTIHDDLAEKELLPEQHLVDAGYITSATLVQSQSGYGVDLVGPTLKTHWYQAETGYDLTHFSIDWEAETVTCPQGQISLPKTHLDHIAVATAVNVIQLMSWLREMSGSRLALQAHLFYCRI